MPQDAPISVSRAQLLDLASAVAWNFKAYGSYEGKHASAIRAIRKRCPGFTSRQYANAFAKALKLYDAVESLVRERAQDLWDAHKSGDNSWPQFLDADLRSCFPGFRLSTFHSLVGIMFFYWHMK